MKKLLVAATFAVSLLAWSAAAEELTGIITDAKCKHTDTSAKSIQCAQQCIKSGEKAVLISSADQKVYTIANPDKIESHIGHKVTVDGDVSGDTLTVNSVKMAKGKGKKTTS